MVSLGELCGNVAAPSNLIVCAYLQKQVRMVSLLGINDPLVVNHTEAVSYPPLSVERKSIQARA